MAATKHRTFNADRFLDKFTDHEAVLVAHMARWPDLTAPNPLTMDAFKDYLKAPHGDNENFEQMVEALYQAYDLSTKQGHELMGEAIDQNQLTLPGLHDVSREVLALRLHIENPVTFTLATNLLFASQVDKFVSYKGKEPRAVADVAADVVDFRAKLGELFVNRKGTDKIVVQHFTDGDALNFIVYHERRMTAELELKLNGAAVYVKSRSFRPARQDFIAYYPKTGRLEIETPIPKERDLMRTAFAVSFLKDEGFFSGPGSEVALRLQKLTEPGFAFSVDEGHYVALREITFKLPQNPAPTFTIKSKNAFTTLNLNRLRDTFAGATVKAALISIAFGEGKRPKRVELSSSNTLSFSRATRANDVLTYLRRWQLLVD